MESFIWKHQGGKVIFGSTEDWNGDISGDGGVKEIKVCLQAVFGHVFPTNLPISNLLSASFKHSLISDTSFNCMYRQ